MLLKAKFKLSPATVQAVINDKFAAGENRFFVEPVAYDDKACFVVGEASPVMYLIGDIAGRGEDGLLNVSAV
jgi:hypothetical protein